MGTYQPNNNGPIGFTPGYSCISGAGGVLGAGAVPLGTTHRELNVTNNGTAFIASANMDGDYRVTFRAKTDAASAVGSIDLRHNAVVMESASNVIGGGEVSFDRILAMVAGDQVFFDVTAGLTTVGTMVATIERVS